ncbi:hypothetical protein N2152v2_009840 [Parachlorella kessleri]
MIYTQPGWDEGTAQGAYQEAYQRGFEEGLLAAHRQLLETSTAAHGASTPALVLSAASASAVHTSASQRGAAAADSCRDCHDSVLRSAVKGLSWRIFGMGVTMLLAYFVLGGGEAGGVRWRDMLRFGGMEFITKYLVFFLHERMWATIPFLR